MSKTIDYHYALTSPWTYLGGPRFDAIVKRHGASVNWKPIDVRQVFPATGGLPLAKRAPERQAYRLMELKRWRALLEMPLNLHPKHFPVPDELAARVVIAADRAGQDVGPLSNAILRAVWAEERDITDGATLVGIAESCGLDDAALLKGADDPAVQAAYQGYTAAAIKRGVFGVPTYVYQDELFWGQDRLDLLDRTMAKVAD